MARPGTPALIDGLRTYHVRAAVVGLLVAVVGISAPGFAQDAELPVPEDAVQLPIDVRNPTEPADLEDLGTPLDLARIDGPAVEGYAIEHGVTKSEASAALRWESVVLGRLAPLMSRWNERLAYSTFAGPSVSESHAPELHLYLLAPTAADKATVDALPGIVRIFESKFTRAQALQVIYAAEDQFRADNPDILAKPSLDYLTGDVTFDVHGPIAYTPQATCSPSSNETGGKLDGGRGFALKAEGSGCALGYCTLGFSGYFNGKQGAVTAGHCVDDSPLGPDIDYAGTNSNGAYVCCGDDETFMEALCRSSCGGQSRPISYAAIRPYFSYLSPAIDTAFVREKYASTETSSQVYVPPRTGSSASGFYRIWGFHDGTAVPEMVTVCQSAGANAAESPGEHCGAVFSWAYGYQSSNRDWVWVDNYNNLDGSVQSGGPGSSGGPWYMRFQNRDVIGLGTHSGVDTSARQNSFFYRVDKIFSRLQAHAPLRLYCDNGDGKMMCQPTNLSTLLAR